LAGLQAKGPQFNLPGRRFTEDESMMKKKHAKKKKKKH